LLIKKGVAILGICTLALTACAGNDTDQAGQGQKVNTFNETDNHLHTNSHEPGFKNSDMKKNDTGFGYVRYKRTGVMTAEDQPKFEIDREQLADMISKLSAQVPNVDDVSTLVTDEEVLVVYATDTEDRHDTANQVKKMAMSVVPGWYHIYVTDDTGLRQNIENFATLNTNSREIHDLIDGVVKQMKSTPQGTVNEKGYENSEAQNEEYEDNTQSN